jgi:Ubiquitin family
MWISFNCQQPFAVKVFVGGINVVTGESKRKTPEMVKCQQERFANNESMQDYVVPPDQLWLDGIATMDGKVMQFIATPVGTGYSVEAQVTGEDKIAGVQFEITPKLPDPYHTMAPFSTETPDQLIYIRHLTSTSLPLRVALSYTVDQVKTLVEERVKLAVRDQRLTYHGIQLEGGEF